MTEQTVYVCKREHAAAGSVPSNWTLGPGVGNNPPVLAYLNGKIYQRRVRDAGWGVLAGGDIDRITGVQFVALGNPDQPPPPVEAGPKPGNIF